jgi:hypothetical protein
MPYCVDFGKYEGEIPKEFTLTGFEFQQIGELPGRVHGGIFYVPCYGVHVKLPLKDGVSYVDVQVHASTSNGPLELVGFLGGTLVAQVSIPEVPQHPIGQYALSKIDRFMVIGGGGEAKISSICALP